MATDVDLLNATISSAVNGSSMNQTNSSDSSLDGLFYNTTQVLATEALTGGLGSTEKQWGWLATIVLLLATLLVNGAVLGVTWKTTRLHSSLYALLGSLAFAHTLNAFLVMPMAINAAIHDESEVSWSVCVAWMCLTQFLMSVVLVHLGLATVHCLVLLLSPLWYRQCTGIIYPCLLTTSAWVVPLLLIVPGAAVLNTSEQTNCADPLSIETIIALHIPTYYGPAITVVVIYSIVTYIVQNKSRVTNQLQHEGVENQMAGNKIQRDRWSSILSNHSSMVTYNSETPSICSDNASVHSIPSIDNDDGSAVAISLPNGRNGFVHLNQAPPNGLFVPMGNGDIGADHVPNGFVPNGNAEAPRRLITNGSAVCLPDTISPATTEDDKKKKQPPRDVLKQMSSDSDSMQLEIHKVDVDDDNVGNEIDVESGNNNNNKDNENTNPEDPDLHSNVPDEQVDIPDTLNIDSDTPNVKESVNRKLSAISEAR